MSTKLTHTRATATVVIDTTSRLQRVRAARADPIGEFVKALPVSLFLLDHGGVVRFSNVSCSENGKAPAASRRIEDELRLLPLRDKDKGSAGALISMVLSRQSISLSRTYPSTLLDYPVLVLLVQRFGAQDEMVLVMVSYSAEPSRRRRRPKSRQVMILEAQDEERRRIARELHDGTCQQVALAQLTLENVRHAKTFEEIEKGCLDIEAVLSSAQSQMRTLSYVLHPPELTGVGIAQALKTFINGFSRRTGLAVLFENAAGELHPCEKLDLAIYRVAQEALVNVNKHARANLVTVRLSRAAKHLVLQIEDDGIGVPQELARGHMPEVLGVGLSGMCARVQALGGVFRVERMVVGTRVEAHFPQRRSRDRPLRPNSGQR